MLRWMWKPWKSNSRSRVDALSSERSSGPTRRKLNMRASKLRIGALWTISSRSLVVVLAVMMAGVMAGCAGVASPAQDLEAQYREAAEQLICQCGGCTEQLSVCAMQNCHSATPMRAEIREKLAQGVPIPEIVASFVKTFGKQVLSAPTMEGFDLTAWVMPFVMLVLGLVLVSWIVVKMRGPSVGVAPQPVESSFDARVEQELQEFEEES